jgi:hypothetical protein
MKLEHNLNTDISEVVLRARITTYLTNSGFRLVSSQPDLAFRRGSLFGSVTSFSPRGWESVVVTRFSPTDEKMTQVAIVLQINTSGQWVTDKERKFWQAELDNLNQAISTGDIDVSATTENATSALIQNLTALLLMIGLGVVMAIGGLFVFGTYVASLFTGFLGFGLGFVIVQRWLGFRIW